MKIIIGFGNPEAKYDGTRHNIGFAVLDEFQKTFKGNFSAFKMDTKLSSVISEGVINEEKILLVKPQLYYNLSGEVAKKVLSYYKQKKESLIVLHDDIALPLGRIKIITDSSAGGNNGIKSCIEHLKSQHFTRIKIGVWNEIKEKAGASDFVLSKFNAKEKKVLGETINKVHRAIVDLIEYYPDLPKVQNIYN